jgi:hypothetical protein
MDVRQGGLFFHGRKKLFAMNLRSAYANHVINTIPEDLLINQVKATVFSLFLVSPPASRQPSCLCRNRGAIRLRQGS